MVKGLIREVKILISQINTDKQQTNKTLKKWCMWQTRFKKRTLKVRISCTQTIM